MLSAVTLSRSPPRADTTMMATDDRSRISWHSSNPSISGSMRSSRTMSGSSVSSRLSARSPSTETTVSKPRTARLDRIRSTMFGSSSTTRARVFPACVGISAGSPRRRRRSFGGHPRLPGIPASGVPGRRVRSPVSSWRPAVRAWLSGFSTGSVIRKQVPWTGWTSSIRPPWASTMPRAMDSPRPEPELGEPRAAHRLERGLRDVGLASRARCRPRSPARYPGRPRWR